MLYVSQTGNSHFDAVLLKIFYDQSLSLKYQLSQKEEARGFIQCRKSGVEMGNYDTAQTVETSLGYASRALSRVSFQRTMGTR